MASTSSDYHKMNWSDIKLIEPEDYEPIEDRAIARLPRFATSIGDMALLVDALGLGDALQRRASND